MLSPCDAHATLTISVLPVAGSPYQVISLTEGSIKRPRQSAYVEMSRHPIARTTDFALNQKFAQTAAQGQLNCSSQPLEHRKTSIFTAGGMGWQMRELFSRTANAYQKLFNLCRPLAGLQMPFQNRSPSADPGRWRATAF